MDIAALFTQLPMFLATLVLVIAAALKVGREQGGLLTLLGALLLLVMTVASPLVYQVLMPRVLETMEPESIQGVYRVIGLLMNLAHALAVLLIALGVFLRPARVAAR